MVSSTKPEIVVVERKIHNYVPRYSKRQFKTFYFNILKFYKYPYFEQIFKNTTLIEHFCGKVKPTIKFTADS